MNVQSEYGVGVRKVGLVRVFARWMIATGLSLPLAGCATRIDALHARFVEPDYVVTRQFFEQAPQRVAVLPFATRSEDPEGRRGAAICRRVFYQQLSVRSYEDIDLRKFDADVVQNGGRTNSGALKQISDAVRKLDIVGMTTLLDLPSLFGHESLEYENFRSLLASVEGQHRVDAYFAGITRSYGRFYGVLLSSIGVSTRIELRSAATGDILWRGEKQQRRNKLPFTLNPFGVPMELYRVWENSRGEAMDKLAFDVYGELCKTLPYLPARKQVFVETTDARTRLYDSPTVWMYSSAATVGKGMRMPFQLEENGWYRCKGPGDRPLWVFRRSARLVDETGEPIDLHADEKL